MRPLYLASTALLLSIALAPAIAAAQQPRPGNQPPAAQPGPRGQPPQQQAPQQAAPIKPYKPVAVQLPPAPADPSLAAFRKEIAGIAQRKDRAALARLVVARGFFWEREDGKGADAKKSGLDNLVAALDLGNQDGSGWEALAAMADEAHAAPDQEKKGVVCAPATPNLNDKDFEDLTKQTQTDPSEWGYPNADGVEVRRAGQPNAPVIDKLGLYLVRVLADESSANAAGGGEWIKIVTPKGSVGFVPNSAVNTLVADQICYIKDASGWKIAGIIGGGEDQQ